MERLVNDLLRLARLDAGQETPELAPATLRCISTAVVTELAPRRSRRGSRDPRARRRRTPQRRDADPAKLHDVLRNLLENAINYSPEDGTVVGGARRHGDNGTSIEVADRAGHSGRGPRRACSSASTAWTSRGHANPGGTGIGLAIVKHLVELLGGTVGAANRPEGGAVFTVTPAARTVLAGRRPRCGRS